MSRRVKHSKEIEDTLRALRRAAKRALELGLQTGTPVMCGRTVKSWTSLKNKGQRKNRSALHVNNSLTLPEPKHLSHRIA